MAKTKTTKQATKNKQKSPGDTEVTICRRRNDRRQAEADCKTNDASNAQSELDLDAADELENQFTAAPFERRKVPRRRQIDPTTCERDYTSDEIEFMHALDAYKRSSGRMFPTCSEVLEVVRGLGYVRLEDDAEAQAPATEGELEEADLVEVGADPIA